MTFAIPFRAPPLDDSANVSEALDFHIANRNLTPIYSFAVGNEDNSSSRTAVLTSITHFEFARATHRVAHLVRPMRTGVDGEVVAIIALADTLLYQTLFAGCSKAGFVPFPISPRNAPAAMVHLLKATNARRVFTTGASLGPLIGALKAQNICVDEMPTLAEMYPFLGCETPDSAFTPYPPPAIPAALEEVACYLHSSGSTGLPKAIPLTHRSIKLIAGLDVFPGLVKLQPSPLPRLRIAAGALPSFHATGVVIQLIGPLYHGITACISAPASLGNPAAYAVPSFPTPQSALEVAILNGADCIMTIPVFLTEWAKVEKCVAYLRTLKLTMFTGGPLSKDVGDALVKQGIKLAPMYGSTEIGFVNTLFPEGVSPQDWIWMQLSARVNPRWTPVDGGALELQLLTVPTHLPNVENLSDTKGYSTEDLFERHPTLPNLYRIVGRLDDVIIMANGEKAVPGPLEDIIVSSPLVSNAIMFGRERTQVGVLVEPSPMALDPETKDLVSNFRDQVWKVVQDANAVAPAFARVHKEMILVTAKERPFVRTLKGTIARKATIALYDGEIKALYDAIETSENVANEVVPPSSWTAKDLESWLLSQACSVLATESTSAQIDPAADLFEQGFDSLQATFLRHRIVSALRSVELPVQLDHTFVYANPSIQKLACAIEALVSGKKPLGDPQALVEAMIAKYSQGFNSAQLATSPSRPCGSVVLLTGSTGGLGSHILELLLRLSSVDRVYAFNRPGRFSVAERQSAAFREHALDAELLKSSKLVYLEGDSGRADLGLSAEMYDELEKSVTCIIHNAWTLDFNKSLSSFEPHIRGTRNLIDLAHLSSARLLFTSSISSAQNWDKSRGAFPEEVQLDSKIALGSGYGESKYVSERILAASGLTATSFRIGQISGSRTNGSWATTDWVPTLVKSSMTLGCFPSDPDRVMVVSWIPPEAVAQAIVDTAMHDAPPFAVNLVHPRPVEWDSIVGAMAHAAKLPMVPISKWIEMLERRGRESSAEVLAQMPALKLLGFIKGAMNSEGSFNVHSRPRRRRN
ncbi:Aminoadipate reductase [Mycena chlorophos]|uniref:Aminoadipate reductase n=1 Tax=Mycena chlorophos TaxID=658473 RepID=A0A8H6SE45_MYCCL|nr:Aminoadipate reductase [Mycena chlorophos]